MSASTSSLLPHDRDRFDYIYDGKVLPFGSEEFDSVLCTEVLEHCPQPTSLITEIARVLKPGGYLLLTVPMVIHHHEEPHDFQRFTRYGVEELARNAGLESIWIKPRGGLYSATISLFYTSIGYSFSRRPFSDFIYWILWPFVELALKLETLGNSSTVLSLGWQMLTRKRLFSSTDDLVRG